MATFAEMMLAKYNTLVQTSTGRDNVSVDGGVGAHGPAKPATRIGRDTV